MQVARIVVETIMHNGKIVTGPKRCQEIDGRLSTRGCERVVLNVVYVDIGVECETDVLLDPEDVNEFVPKFDLVFFAGWLGWAVGFA
jgi:hypothetical protein